MSSSSEQVVDYKNTASQMTMPQCAAQIKVKEVTIIELMLL